MWRPFLDLKLGDLQKCIANWAIGAEILTFNWSLQETAQIQLIIEIAVSYSIGSTKNLKHQWVVSYTYTNRCTPIMADCFFFLHVAEVSQATWIWPRGNSLSADKKLLP